MADLDNDGDMDLLVGDSDGFITVYIRDDEGGLSSSGHLAIDDEELDVGFRASVQTTDWDLDGDLDLLVGSAEGTVTLMTNEGSAEEFSFTNSGTIDSDGQEIWLGEETSPYHVDLDGDDVRDLIIGSIWGELDFYRNIGEDDAPEFAEGVQLNDLNGGIFVEGYSRPELVDWDEDGDLDIVVGLIDPEVRLYLNMTIGSVQDEIDQAPLQFSILSNYPEPFNNRTTILFQNRQPQTITIELTDVSGRLLQTVNLGSVVAGEHRHNLDLSPFSGGKYFITLRANDQSITRSLTLIK